MAVSARFSYVCNTCKWRKKACDKKLPTCSYCAQRSIACRYPDAAPGTQATRIPAPASSNDGSNTPDTVNKLAASARADLLLIHSVSDHAYLLPLSGFPTDNESFDSIVHKRVSRLLQAIGLSVEDILERQPNGIYYSLPIVLKDQFASYQHEIASFIPPTADASVLMLAAALLSFGRDVATRTTDLVDKESLFLTTKTLYAQIQAVMQMSMPLIQAGVVIAMYEYLSGRFQGAMATLGNSSAMLHAHGTASGTGSTTVPESPPGISPEVVQWCIIMIERLAACEIDWRSSSFALSIPDPDTRLIYHPSMLGWNKNCDPSVRDSPRIRDVATPGRGLLGAVQACWLLDRVFQLIESPQPLESKLSEVYALAEDLRTLLNVALEIEGNEGGSCGAIGATIRAMFLFRTYIANTAFNDPEMEKLYTGSQMALQTATRITIDLAQSRADGYALQNIDFAAPACRYAVRAALRYLGEYEQQHGTQQTQIFNRNAKDVLRGLMSNLEQRWQVVPSRAVSIIRVPAHRLSSR